MSKTSFNGKSIGAEDELGIDNIEDIICQTLEVVTSANFLGSVFFTTLELNSIGSYQQTGNVDFNYNNMSNINIVSGSIDGIDIGANNPGSGKFTSLQTGIPGTGYQVYFYSDNTGNYFNYDGDNGILKVTNRSTFGITNPFGFFQVSPVKYSRGKVQISDNQTNPGPGKIIVGNSDVTFPTDIVGYYLVLDDNTKTKIVERLSDKLLTCDGPDSNGEDLQKSEQGYNIYYPGVVIDDYGNLNAGGSGHLTVPSGNTASRSTSAVTGSIRYNTEQNLFEGYTGDKWGSIGGTGSQDNQTKLIFDKFVNDNKVRLVSNNKDTLIVANNGKLNLGYINTYGHLKTSSNKSILNENSISSDLIEEYNININSELVDQNSNESGVVGSVTNSSLTFSSQTWGSLSSSAPLYSTNGVPFRLYRNNTSSFDLYGSQSESIGYDNSFYNNLTYSGSGLELNDISIDVNNYNSVMHKEYSIKISSVHGLNDLILNSTNISSNVTLQVLITDTEDIDKFRIKIVGENNFSIVQTNTGQNISLNIIKPSTGLSIGNIDISFTNTTGHVINEIWTIAISNSTFNSISFSNPNIGADKFMWKISSDPNSTYSNDNLVSTQYTTINDGIQIKFNSLTGHTLNNVWTFKVYSKNRITAINNNDIITSNDNIKNILNINDAITLYDNTYKYTYLVKEFISEDDTQQIYKVRLNKNFVGASSTNYKGLYDANLISLHNGYGKTKFRIDRSGNIGVLTSYTDKINTSLYLNTTDAIKIPVGTTEQRPSTNETGYVRYNNTTKYMELYDQNKYVNICTNGAIVSPNLKNKAYITDNNSFIVTINNSSIFNLTKDNVSINVPTNFSSLTDGIMNIVSGTISGVKYFDSAIASITKNLNVSTLSDGILNIYNGTITNVNYINNNYINSNIGSISQNLYTSSFTDGHLSINNGTITNVKLLESNELNISGSATITGNLAVAGSITVIHTDVNTSEQISVTNDGTGPALIIKQRGNQDIMNIMDTNAGTIVNSNGVVKTSSSSNSVTLNSTDYNNISIDAEITANNIIRNVISKNNNNIITIDSAVDWDNNGAGYSFTYKNPIHALYIKDGGLVGIGTSNPNTELQVIGTSLLHTLTDGVAIVSGGSITGGTYIDTDIASISSNFSAVTLTDGVAIVSGGSITGGTYIDIDVASVSSNFSAVTLTDGVAIVSGGSITGGTYIDTDIASISSNFSAVTLTDGVAVVSGGSITGSKYIDTDVASVSSNFSAVTLTDGIMIISGGSITNGTYIDTDIASISTNISARTYTDGKIVINNGTISNVNFIETVNASVSSNFSAVTLTDSIAILSGGSITGSKYIDTDVASVSDHLSIATLTDGNIIVSGGSITGSKYIDIDVASVSEHLSVATLTDGNIIVSGGSITGSKYIDIDVASISVLAANTFYGDGSNLTGLNADKIIKNDTEIVVEDTGSNGHAKFIIDGSEKVRINTSGFIGVGTTNPVVSLDLDTTDALALPSGNTSQRPSNAKNGMIRYNNTTYNLEYYNNGWSNVGSSNSSGSVSSITQVGNPSTGTFSSLGFGNENPQISSTNNIPDAFQILDRWIARFLVDTPPPPTLVSSSTTSTKVSISWNNPLQFEVGILNTKVPKINEIKIDFKKSSNSNWTTISTSSTSITSLEFYIEGSGSGVSGNIYKFYTIDKETNYDFRIYGINDNNERNLQYLTVSNLATVGIGVPSVPTNLAGTVNSDTQVTLSYTKPQYNDSVNNTTSSPYIEYYKASINTTNSIRYGGVLSDSRDVLSSIGNNADAPTSLVITNMNPGTTYSLKVAAKNTQNANYSNYSSIITKTTNFPSAPSYLVTSNANNINNSAILRGNYQTSGYSIDGITLRNNIFNINNISNGIETELTSQFRINYNEASTDNIVSIIRAFGGLTSQYNNSNNTSSTNIGGFGISSVVGDYTNGASKLTITEDQEYYGTTKYQGFYKVAKCKAVANNSSNYYVASADSYSLQLQQEVVISGSNNIINTNKVDFYLDSLNSNPVINNLLISDIIINNTSNDIKYISGILTYDTSATFKFQFNLENLGDYNLRNDKKHAYLGLYNGSTLISNGLTIYRQNFSSSGSKYYTEPTNKYETSSTLYNTDGYTLTPKQNRENIQINSFTFNMSNINNVYSENVVIKGTPYNLYGTGSTVSASSINTLNGNSMGNIRVDGKSIVVLDNTNSSTGNYGLHVRSGYDSSSLFYPSGPGNGNNDFGDSYDNTANINSTNNPRYDKELQLINGYYTSYNTYAYKDYSNYYVSSSVPNSYNYPNYSSIYTNEINDFRFATFKYTNLISNSNGCRITFVNSSGFSSVTPSDISLHIKINNSSSSGYNTGWLNANDAVSGVGVTSSNKNNNGTTCLSISGSYISTSTLKYCYLPSPTTGDLYIRLGIKIGSNKSISYMSVQNNLS